MGTIDGQKKCKMFLMEPQYTIVFILLSLLD